MKNPFMDIEGGGLKAKTEIWGRDGKIQSFILSANNSKGE